MFSLDNLNIEIYSDGASIEKVVELAKLTWISGFTTNPSLMRSEGVNNYVAHCLELSKQTGRKPISFEILTDDFDKMYNQALEISDWGSNVFVKIPIITSEGLSTEKVILDLSKNNINLNITAVFTLEQVASALKVLSNKNNSIISIFAGRIADTGVDPTNLIKDSIKLRNESDSNTKILWASTREIFNIVQAEKCGADIITVPNDLLEKTKNLNKDLKEFSIETSKMFIEDSKKSNFYFEN
jgi:transaldolase